MCIRDRTITLIGLGLLGQVTLSSHQAFTVTPGHADNAFSANTAEISSALASSIDKTST